MLGSFLVVSTWNAWGQPPFLKGRKPDARDDNNNNSALPTDPRLLKLVRDYVINAEKLAREYEQAKQYDKCREVCQEILKIAPNYPGAVDLIKGIDQREQTAEKATFDILATEGWQDTGIVLLEGKPVSIVARGVWTFSMEYDLSPDGIDIPRELRDFKLGALIGFIDTGANPLMDKSKDNDKFRPFHIGAARQMTSDKTGRLWMRMHDADPRDNKGKVTVDIQGTFQKLKK